MEENTCHVLHGDARTWKGVMKEGVQEKEELCLGLKGMRKWESARL